jgi:hypothetical protein
LPGAAVGAHVAWADARYSALSCAAGTSRAQAEGDAAIRTYVGSRRGGAGGPVTNGSPGVRGWRSGFRCSGLQLKTAVAIVDDT